MIMVMAYIIHELQNLDSVRLGTQYEGTLRAAKARASREQAWQGTILKITDEQGRTVAVKGRDGWIDYDEYGEAQP